MMWDLVAAATVGSVLGGTAGYYIFLTFGMMGFLIVTGVVLIPTVLMWYLIDRSISPAWRFVVELKR
jgi:hypothetical protein